MWEAWGSSPHWGEYCPQAVSHCLNLMRCLFAGLLSSFYPALDSTHGVASVTLHTLPGWGSPRFQHHNHFTEHEMKVPGTAKPLTQLSGPDWLCQQMFSYLSHIQ